jgi:uncharacterized protein
MTQDTNDKTKQLSALIQAMNPLVVAFSGGLDSSYLLAMSIAAIGKKNVIAVTAQSPVFSPFETQYIDAIIKKTGVKHLFFHHPAMSKEKFIQNPPDRCYHCKKIIFSEIRNIADKLGIQHIAHGENSDDLKDYRPGSRAAKEFDIKSPLTAAQLSKTEISRCAKDIGLPNWNQSGMACLATRIPYHSVITMEKLTMIHQAELLLFNMGFPATRVRWIDGTAKIEFRNNHLPVFLKKVNQDMLLKQLKDIGYIDMIVENKRKKALNKGGTYE